VVSVAVQVADDEQPAHSVAFGVAARRCKAAALVRKVASMSLKGISVCIGVVTIVAASSAVAAGDATGLKLTSTLDGKKTLPHRIHWIATAKPAASVRRVEFLIDGKLRWVETNPPYVYGDDGNWLVTSWLSAGRHRFSVRAVSTANRRTTRSVVALVGSPPAVPAELATSRWTRVYTKAETGDAPAGKWTLSITPAGWKIMDPAGGGNFIDVAYLAPGSLETRGGIWTRPRASQEPNVKEGNGWCEDTNEPVRFKWSVAADKLTFTLRGPTRCDGLGDFLSKTWSRAS
jgi:hypothetical protein